MAPSAARFTVQMDFPGSLTDGFAAVTRAVSPAVVAIWGVVGLFAAPFLARRPTRRRFILRISVAAAAIAGIAAWFAISRQKEEAEFLLLSEVVQLRKTRDGKRLASIGTIVDLDRSSLSSLGQRRTRLRLRDVGDSSVVIEATYPGIAPPFLRRGDFMRFVGEFRNEGTFGTVAIEADGLSLFCGCTCKPTSGRLTSPCPGHERSR